MQTWQTLKETRPERPRRDNGTFLPRHGRKYTPLYKLWSSMHARCSDPDGEKYSIYGGRGIQVCAEWRTFEPFEAWALSHGHRQGLQIDRIDTNGNYEPDNCRFVTCLVNNNNRRNNRRVTAFSETKTVAEWARDFRCVVSAFTLYKRLNLLAPEIAITMQVRAGSSLIKRSNRAL